MDTVMVNFRIPETDYHALRREAQRRTLSFSQFIRNCLSPVCEQARRTAAEESLWADELPPQVRGLVGLAAAHVGETDSGIRDEHRRHLEEKYA